MASTYVYHYTEIWKQDWFLQLMKEFPLDFGLYFYIRDNCTHGVWRATMADYQNKTGRKPDLFKFAEACNRVEDHLVFIRDRGLWFLPFYFQEVHGFTHSMYILHKPGINGKKACPLCVGFAKHIRNNNIPISMIIGIVNKEDFNIEENTETAAVLQTVDPVETEAPPLLPEKITDEVPTLIAHPAISSHPTEKVTVVPEMVQRELILNGKYKTTIIYPYDGTYLASELETWLKKCNWDTMIYNSSIRSDVELKNAVEDFIQQIIGINEKKSKEEINKHFFYWLRKRDDNNTQGKSKKQTTPKKYSDIKGMK